MNALFPDKTLQDLEWPRFLGRLAERCTGEEAAQRCLELPFLEPEQVPRHLALVDELLQCLQRADPPPALPARHLGEWLARVRSDAAVPGEGLRDIAVNLKLYVAIARYLENRRDACPRNADLALPGDGSLTPFPLARLAAEIESAFEPDGSISDNASPELGKLRRRVIALRQSLVTALEKIAEEESDLLRDRTITLRNDRFVLAVRADAHRRLRGIVHGSSGSQSTIFVEPEKVVDVGNELMLSRDDVAREEQRVLLELSRAVRDHLGETERASRFIVEVEVRIAAARLSEALEAAVPALGEPGEVELVRARHPLLVLDGVDVVPNAISARKGQATVISGPNAGGKTVVLKTVGLLGLMLASGLPIPAGPGTRMGIPRRILTDIGDDQSLELNLSTFSAHMTNLAAIFSAVKRGSLVLLDELASGTDPAEGAALAEAVLERFGAADATIFATTHFDALKARAQGGAGFVNAAVGFDVDRLQPTFELRVGTPGASSALSIAQRYGLPEIVVQRARDLLPGGMRELARAVQALEEERTKAAEERRLAEEERRLAEEARRRHADELERLRARQNKLIDKEAEELWSELRSAREKMRELEKGLKRRRVDAAELGRARDEVNAIAAKLEPGGELAAREAAALPGRVAESAELTLGARVFVPVLGKWGIIEAPPRGDKVFVRVGSVKTQVRTAGLRIEEAQKVKRGKAQRAPRDAAPDPEAAEAMRTSDNTLDLRGLTVDEALNATDAFLDQALGRGLGAVFVLHGHGTGALRDAVRDYLKSSRYVEAFRKGEPGEGGDGITCALLR